MRLSGPLPVTLCVFITCGPAVCVPLNGVVTFGQPAATASAGLSNHRPRWNMCTGAVAGLLLASGNGPVGCGVGAGTDPGATTNVSTLNRPMNFCVLAPVESVTMSP